MKKLAAFLLLSPAMLLAAESTILGGELFDKGKKLTVEEIKAIIVSDVDVEQINGNTAGIRRWKNNADGKFIASRVAAFGGGAGVSGQGEWKLTENGQYCVQIEWRPRAGPEQENWCRTLWTYDGELYLAPADLAPNRERKYGQIKFKK